MPGYQEMKLQTKPPHLKGAIQKGSMAIAYLNIVHKNIPYHNLRGSQYYQTPKLREHDRTIKIQYHPQAN